MEISILSSPTLSLPSFQKRTISSSNSSFFFIPTQTSSTFLRPVHSTGPISLARCRPVNPAGRRGMTCNSLFGLGVPELAVIAGVAALVFGPKQIPELGRSIGKTVRGFQEAAKEFEAELKKPEDSESTNEAKDAKSVSDSSEDKKSVSATASKESS